MAPVDVFGVDRKGVPRRVDDPRDEARLDLCAVELGAPDPTRARPIDVLAVDGHVRELLGANGASDEQLIHPAAVEVGAVDPVASAPVDERFRRWGEGERQDEQRGEQREHGGEGQRGRSRSLLHRPRHRFSLTRSFSVSLFPARSVSFTESFAFAFSPRFSAAAIFFAFAFFGFSFSVLVLPAASWTFFGFSL